MKRTILLVTSLLLCVSGAQAIQTISDSCSGTTSCTLAGAHSAGDLIIWWAYRAGSLTAPTGATGTLVTTSSSSVGASRSWRMNCSVAVAGSIASGTWTNATNMGAVAITDTSATTTANCATDAVGSKGTPNNVSSATATYAAVTMAAGAQSIGLAVMGSSTSGNTCTPTSATVVAGATTGDVRVSLANAQGNWASTTCAITSSVTTEFVVEVKATIVATPTFSPNGGTFGTSVSETLSDTTGGASICYTTDGSTPAAATAGTCSAGSTYSSPFSVATDATTLKALGTAAALANSAVATSSAFTINAFRPSLALAGVSGGIVPVVAPCAAVDYGNGWILCQQVIGANAGAGSTNTQTLPGATISGHQLAVMVFGCGDVGCSGSTAAITCSIAHGTDTSPEGASGNPYRTGGSSNYFFYAWVFPYIQSTSTSVALTCSGGTPFYLSVYASEWSGGKLSGIFDSTITAANFGGSGTSASITAGTTTNATDLVLGAIALNTAGATTPGSGFTEIGDDAATGVEHEAKSVSSTGSQACTFTFGTSTWQGICATLRH